MRIKGEWGNDDFASMHEVVGRYFRRRLDEQKPLPDLVLIDGGKGQLNMAREVLQELAVPELILLGVAKGVTRKPGLETLYLNDAEHEFTLPGDSPALHLIQQVRDEAHRFAITGHRARRGKARTTSTLEDVPGIGPKRRRELLKHFGGLGGLKNASADEIAHVEGVSSALAERILELRLALFDPETVARLAQLVSEPGAETFAAGLPFSPCVDSGSGPARTTGTMPAPGSSSSASPGH